jgi:hypothetical protein
LNDRAHNIEVSVVMPCLNEAETLAGCIREAQAALQSSGVSGEVLVADNGSSDGSQSIAVAAGARVVEVPARGYGSALLAGITAARGQFVLMGDADGSYDFGELPRFLAELRRGRDLVMGCRLPAGGGTIEKGAMPWKHRWIGNPVLSGLGRVFFKAPVQDFHCGLRAFRREAILELGLNCSGMEFASEMVVKALLSGVSISEVPIHLRPDGRSRPPHLRSWRDGWRHLRFMLLFTPRWLFLYPGLLLSVLGLLGCLALVGAPRTVAGVTFDTNTLLVCSAMLVSGVQLLFFAVFTKAYGVQAGLLAPDRRIEAVFRHSLVEWGVVAGLLLLATGSSFVLMEFLRWRGSEFGDLSYPDSLRVMVPAVTAIALGVQSLFSGFALSVLGLSGRLPARS